MIVAIVAVTFCILGALILFLYREKKIMKTIAKEEDKAYLEAIESEEEIKEAANEVEKIEDTKEEIIIQNETNDVTKEDSENIE